MTNPRITLPRAPSSLEYTHFIESLLPNRLTKPDFFAERHHIVPRCMGGSDEPDNLIYLTPSEHLRAHRLLVDAFPEEGKLKNALWFMSHLMNDPKDEYEYEELRLLCKSALSTRRKGDASPETRAKISLIHRGKTIPEEQRRAISLAVSNYLRNNPQGKKQAAQGGRSTKSFTWWHNGEQTTRSLNCPGEGWSPGRGDNVSEAMSKAGSTNKGKVYWHKLASDGSVIRKRSFESPGDDFLRGYGPKR
jgi:hypothetical protein